jgi:hypothetical protein
MSSETSPDPLERLKAIAGEHFPNYVIIVDDDNVIEGCRFAFNNEFSATGLVLRASKLLRSAECSDVDNDWIWVEDDDDDEEASE